MWRVKGAFAPGRSEQRARLEKFPTFAESGDEFECAKIAARVVSPYDRGPLTTSNPLEKMLLDCIDFDRLKQAPIKLFVAATNVRTGRGCERWSQ